MNPADMAERIKRESLDAARLVLDSHGVHVSEELTLAVGIGVDAATMTTLRILRDEGVIPT